LEQYCYKIYVKTTIIWECENRIHPKNNTLLLEIVDLQGLLTGPPTDLPKRLVGRLLVMNAVRKRGGSLTVRIKKS